MGWGMGGVEGHVRMREFLEGRGSEKRKRDEDGDEVEDWGGGEEGEEGEEVIDCFFGVS